jgi:hypothetical protein
MLASLSTLAALLACSCVAAAAAEPANDASRTAQDDRACGGVTNEATKMRELRRELGAYFGQSIPEDLQNRVRKHIELVAKMKAECDQQREQAAVAKKE